MEKKFMKQVEFAKHIGKTRQHVTNLNRQNKIIKNEDGLVDVEKTMKLLEKTADPSKTKMFKKEKEVLKTNVTDEELEEYVKKDVDDISDFNMSKARKEYYLSKRQELDYLKEKEKLIDVDLVERQYFNLSRQLRDKIFNIKNRISSQLSIISDIVEIQNLLDKEFRNVFREVEEEINNILKEDEQDDD